MSVFGLGCPLVVKVAAHIDWREVHSTQKRVDSTLLGFSLINALSRLLLKQGQVEVILALAEVVSDVLSVADLGQTRASGL